MCKPYRKRCDICGNKIPPIKSVCVCDVCSKAKGINDRHTLCKFIDLNYIICSVKAAIGEPYNLCYANKVKLGRDKRWKHRG